MYLNGTRTSHSLIHYLCRAPLHNSDYCIESSDVDCFRTLRLSLQRDHVYSYPKLCNDRIRCCAQETPKHAFEVVRYISITVQSYELSANYGLQSSNILVLVKLHRAVCKYFMMNAYVGEVGRVIR